MERIKALYTTTIKDYKDGSGQDVEFSIYGVFNTTSVQWKYYAISHVNKITTYDVCSYTGTISLSTVPHGKLFKTKEDGISFIQEFKDKWELGSNDTRQEKRDQKIDNVLGTT